MGVAVKTSSPSSLRSSSFFGSSAGPQSSFDMKLVATQPSSSDARAVAKVIFWDIFDVLEELYGICSARLLVIFMEMSPVFMALADSFRLMVLLLCSWALTCHLLWRRPWSSGRKCPFWTLPVKSIVIVALWSPAHGVPLPIEQQPCLSTAPGAGVNAGLNPRSAEHYTPQEQALLRLGDPDYGLRVYSQGVFPGNTYPDGPPLARPLSPEPLTADIEDTEEHDITDEEVRATHLSFWVCSPGVQPGSVDVALSFPLNGARISEIIVESTRCLDMTWLSEPVATQPQLHNDYGSYLLLPPWVFSSDYKAVLIDGRSFDKGVFSVYVRALLTCEFVLQHAGLPPESDAVLFVGGAEMPLARNEGYAAYQGCLIKILRPGEQPMWASDVTERYDDPALWNPRTLHPPHRPGRYIEFVDKHGSRLHAASREDNRTPVEVVEALFGLPRDSFWLRAPTHRPERMWYRGKRIHSIVAVVDQRLHPKDHTKVGFLDLRPVGRDVQWFPARDGRFHPGAHIHNLHIDFVGGYAIEVHGGKKLRGGWIEIEDGEVLVVSLRRSTRARHGPPPGDGDDDEDEESEDSSPTEDAMPNSSDLSSHSPQGPGPHGPPPPEPVRDRSRSPLRPPPADMRQPCPLQLAEAIPAPVYDLTDNRVTLPYDYAGLAALASPWPPSWVSFDLEALKIEDQTIAALPDLHPWTELFPVARSPSDLEFHLYTDGSYDQKGGGLGYGVVIMLNGTLWALLGLLGGSLYEPQGPSWPIDGPPALRAEQVALAVGLLWSFQAASTFRGARHFCHFDCVAAGWAINGDWAPTDDFASRVHLLELVTRNHITDGVCFSHVKAHSGHPWNSLADATAKAGARTAKELPKPPVTPCQTFLELDLTWSAAIDSARIAGSLPLAGAELTWPTHWDEARPSALRPEQVLPTSSQTWGSGGDQTARFCFTAASINAQGMQGKHQFYEEQLDQIGCNLIMLQEVKQSSSFCMSRRFFRLTTDGLRHWGVSIWVHRKRGLLSLDGKPFHVSATDLTVRAENERLLVLEIAVGPHRVILASVHCPHQARKEEAKRYLDDLATLLQSLPEAKVVVIGADLNARLPPHEPNITGGLQHGEPDEIGQWAVELCRAARHAAVRPFGSTVLYDFDNLNVQDDHFLLRLTAQGPWDSGSRAALWRPRLDRDKMRTPEGRQIIAESLRGYVPPQWEVHPDLHCQHLLDHLQALMREHFTKPANAPRATFIPDFVWRLRATKLRLKVRTKHRRIGWRILLHSGILFWRHGVASGEWVNAVCKHHLLHGIAASAIKVATQLTKRGIQTAKDSFLKGAAKGYEPTTGANHLLSNLKKAGLGQRAKQNFQRQLPLLLDEDKLPVTSREDCDALWLRHFGTQEYGETIELQALLDKPHPPVVQDEELEWKVDSLPSILELERVFRCLPNGKAAGPDSVPGELLKAAPAETARATHALMMKSSMRLHQPLHWRGGTLFAAWKGSGERSNPDSHRSLFVSNILGKCLHKVYKSKTTDCTGQSFHGMHLGSKRGAPVTFPALLILSHVRLALRAKASFAILFLDATQAYYRVCRELCMGRISEDIAIATVFKHFGIPADEIHALHQEICDGGFMADNGYPAEIRHIVKDFHNVAWFTTCYGSGTHVCLTKAGSRPGENFADVIFGFVYERILQQIAEIANGEGLMDFRRYDTASGIYGDGLGGDDTLIQDSTWADDSAFPLMDRSPGALMEKTLRLTSLVVSHCQGLGMRPNLRRGKTSLLLHLRGRGVQAVKRAYFPAGASKVLLPDLGVYVEVVPAYTHLGGVLDHRGALEQESRRRLALAANAYDASKQLILNNRTIELSARTAVFESAVRSTLFNVALWVPRGPAWDRLVGGYTRLMRRLLVPFFGDKEVFRLPDPLVHVLADSVPLELFAKKSRLGLLLSMVIAGPPSLWAIIQAEQGWMACLRDDLAWLASANPTSWPALDVSAWPQWWHLMKLGPGSFRKQVAKRIAEDFEAYKVEIRPKLCLWFWQHQALKLVQPVPTIAASWRCGPCSKCFGSRAGLSAHFFKRHQRRAEYRACVDGTLCRACGRQFWSENRLAVHLRDTPGCVLRLRQHRLLAGQPGGGIGSRAWRQRDSEQYTPALAVAVGDGLSVTEERIWSDTLKIAYKDLSDLLLDADGRQTAISQGDFPDKIVRAYPLYPEEIEELVQTIIDDLQLVGEAGADVHWSIEEHEQLLTALKASQLQDGAERDPNAEQATALLPRLLPRQPIDVDWPGLLRRVRGSHVTGRRLVVDLLEIREAAQISFRDKRANAAVDETLQEVAPPQLRRAWRSLLEGDEVQIFARPEFWATALAAPFVHVGLCFCK
ncbi:unnamed protein product [Symbiodinium sp. CCMP2592]|nr:unnamed protein product [Symbiodinium sp. CCMP2592]